MDSLRKPSLPEGQTARNRFGLGSRAVAGGCRGCLSRPGARVGRAGQDMVRRQVPAHEALRGLEGTAG